MHLTFTMIFIGDMYLCLNAGIHKSLLVLYNVLNLGIIQSNCQYSLLTKSILFYIFRNFNSLINLNCLFLSNRFNTNKVTCLFYLG